MSSTAVAPRVSGARPAGPRRYLMCPPTYFAVTYAINPWMDPTVPVDRGRAMQQWSALVQAYREAGHQVDELAPVPGLPDMVFAANGATVVDGRVLPARFASPERSAEAPVHAAWHAEHARSYGGSRPQRPRAINEGEGDFAILADRILAGYGFRTSPAAHRELAALTGRPVVSLELVDPRFYHLDVALTVLDKRGHIAYYPPAFSPASQQVLGELFPDAVIACDSDALAFGLNSVSDGRRIFVPAGATGLQAELEACGYQPQPIEISELIKGGGAVKCCTQEIRPAPPRTPFPSSPALSS